MNYAVLSLSLLMLGMASGGPREGLSGGIPAFLDADGDGTISEAERQAFLQLRKESRGGGFDKWDSNRDGEIDANERQDAVEQMRTLVNEQRCRLFEGVAGSDGLLTLEEAKTMIFPFSQLPDPVAARIFGLLDRDGDGKVTKEEFLSKLGGPVDSGPASP